MKGVQVIIFDLDDTLTDNKILDFESFRHLSLSLALYTPTMNEIIELRCGSLLAEDIVHWMIEKSRKSVPQILCMKKRKEFLRREGNGLLIKIKPRVRSTLSELKSMGYTLIVATVRNDKKAVLGLLRKHKLAGFFADVYTSRSEVRDKLAEMSGSGVEKAKFKIYQKILRDLKVLPSECLVVGNTLQDLLPALTLGMKVVGTKGSYRTDPALRDSVEIVEDLSDLVKLLQLNCYGGKHSCVF